LRASEIGHSIHRRGILEEMGLPLDAVQSPPYLGLAEALTGRIHECSSVWHVLADPWPDGHDTARPVDAAHALIVAAGKVTTNAERALVSCFSVLCMT
jgi:hypothetical protein